MKKKITTLLAILLLVSLVGCGSNTGSIEPTPSDAAQPMETIEPTEPSTEPTQEPTGEPSTEPTTEPVQEPTTAQTEEPKETVTPGEEPTTETTQEPTTTPTVPTAPVHTHSYSNSVTKQVTCDTNGIITYTCSCGDSYTEAIKATGHN